MMSDIDYQRLWQAATAATQRLHNDLQDRNGIISRLKHELQSIEYALGDARINNTMTSTEVAHEMRNNLDSLREQEPVGVFADVNRHVPGQPPRWEQMIPESWDGDEYIYLYAAPTPPGVPDGWQLVPVVPTDEMLKSVRREMGWCNPVLIFLKMLKAAPKPGDGND